MYITNTRTYYSIGCVTLVDMYKTHNMGLFAYVATHYLTKLQVSFNRVYSRLSVIYDAHLMHIAHSSTYMLSKQSM